MEHPSTTPVIPTGFGIREFGWNPLANEAVSFPGKHS